MIESCGNRLAEDLFFDRRSRETRAFPPDLIGVARRKVLYLHDAAELDLSLAGLPPPSLMKGCDEAAERLVRAIDLRERIVIVSFAARHPTGRVR